MGQTAWAVALLSLSTLVAASPFPAPQGSSDELNELLNVTYWCENWDLLSGESINLLWENGELGVGPWLAGFADLVVGDDGPNHKWADHMMEVAMPAAGDNGLGGCGIPGGECDPNIECEDFARRNYGSYYWALRALVGMHSKLNIAHEYLQNTTITNFLSLERIAEVFTAPPARNDLDVLASLLGVIFYFMGGTAGGAGIAAGARAAATAARVGTLRGARTWANSINDVAAKSNALKKIDTAIANAEANAAVAASTSRALGAFGASTYMIGGTFGIIGIGDGVDSGQIDGGDLQPVLETLFTQSREFLEKIGRMAAGHAEEGDDYNLLPGQQGSSGIYPFENPIAYFYSDGKMLLGESDSTFNDTLKGAFDAFRPRIVDMAMSKALFTVIGDTSWDDEESCAKYGGYGSAWVDDLCLNLFQEYPDLATCENQIDRCQYLTMSEDQHKSLAEEFGFDTPGYMKLQVDCAKAGGTPGEADLDTLPGQDSIPVCWYSVPAYKGTFEGGIPDGGPQTIYLASEDW